jgi:hypothetical protein
LVQTVLLNTDLVLFIMLFMACIYNSYILEVLTVVLLTQLFWDYDTMQTGTRFHIPEDKNFYDFSLKTMKLDYVHMCYVTSAIS